MLQPLWAGRRMMPYDSRLRRLLQKGAKSKASRYALALSQRKAQFTLRKSAWVHWVSVVYDTRRNQRFLCVNKSAQR